MDINVLSFGIPSYRKTLNLIQTKVIDPAKQYIQRQKYKILCKLHEDKFK